ncbi:hypothetical protein ACSSVY_003046 [Roseovarius sp. MBR-51]
MAHKYQPPKFWTCDCDSTTGGHIIDGLYSTCVYCRKHRHELKEIVGKPMQTVLRFKL